MPILKAIGKRKDKNKKPIKVKQTPATFKMLLNYITRKGKDQNEVYKSFGVGLSNDPEKAFKQTLFNWETHDTKEDIRLYKHYTKSYPVGYTDMETIEKITREFVEKNFLDRGFKSYVSIHQDKEHIHAHIITDCTNFLNGYKLQELDREELDTRYRNKELRTHEFTLDQLKNSMEEIALKYGLDSPKRAKEKEKSISKNIGNMAKYKALEKEESYRNKIASVWEEVVLETTTTLENLEDKLKEKGIKISRFADDKRPITLTTSYTDSKGNIKNGKSKLTTLEKEEDYRFNITPNLYNWNNVLEILEHHKSKEFEEELTPENIEKAIEELEKDAELEKEFTKEIEEVKLELDKGREYKTITGIMLGYKEFYKEITSFLKEVEEHKKDFKNLDEIKKIKENEGWELILEFNQAYTLSKQKEKERAELEIEKEKQEKIKAEEERKRKIEDEKIRRNNEYNERHDRIRAEEKAREQEIIKLNRAIEDNKFKDDIKEKEIKPAAEEKEVEKAIKRKEKEREYGE